MAKNMTKIQLQQTYQKNDNQYTSTLFGKFTSLLFADDTDCCEFSFKMTFLLFLGIRSSSEKTKKEKDKQILKYEYKRKIQ